MNITYVENKDGTKLFSFHRHDYKDYTSKNGSYMMIDGGFDYTRYSCDEHQKESWLSESKITDVISDIREQFSWGKNYNKDGTRTEKTEWILLKDLTTDHIKGIIKHIKDEGDVISIVNRTILEIFFSEIEYRNLNNLKDGQRVT